MKNLINSLLIIAFSLFLCSCPKDELCKEFSLQSYIFEIPIKFESNQEIFIGDTISVIADFDKMLFDTRDKNFYLVENFKFFPLYNLTPIDTNKILDGFSNYAKIVDLPNYKNNLVIHSDGGSSLTFDFTEKTDKYCHELNFIPIQKGFYVLTGGSNVHTFDPDQKFEGKCVGRDVDAFFSNSSIFPNNNYELIHHAENHPVYANLDKERFDKGGSVIFEVKEK